ncbi:MAG: Hpt domain-containing protein, partial [Campylobacterota bacterium]|nr:Hpt domain-containing protein [Campylobacterota bacterium]
LDFDLEDVEMLMEVFLESAKENIDLLKVAVESNNLDDIYHISHAIKGSSANLTLMDISNIAKDMEHNSREKNSINYIDKYTELKSLINSIEA